MHGATGAFESDEHAVFRCCEAQHRSHLDAQLLDLEGLEVAFEVDDKRPRLTWRRLAVCVSLGGFCRLFCRFCVLPVQLFEARRLEDRVAHHIFQLIEPVVELADLEVSPIGSMLTARSDGRCRNKHDENGSDDRYGLGEEQQEIVDVFHGRGGYDGRATLL